ncbi:MAG: hypothetical protein PVH48_06120, partial [Cyclobacteriaceae bacterium]
MMKIIKVFSLSALVGLALVACNNSSDFHQQLAKEHAALETEHKNLVKEHQKLEQEHQNMVEEHAKVASDDDS